MVTVLLPRSLASIFEYQFKKTNIDSYYLIYLSYHYIIIIKTIELQVIPFYKKIHTQLIVMRHLNV